MEIKNRRFHFIAIGGVGMSGLAKYLIERGAKVTGSDIQESKYTKILEEKGAKIYIGHKKENIEEGMIIVASSAIKEDNPELKRAKEIGNRIYHRSDILKIISEEFSKKEGSYFIGFSGTHGKTTTSGLCAYILTKGKKKPSYVVGGIIPEIGTNGHYDGDKYFIAELDESDGTIEKYTTDIAVINNIEEDHLDHYKNGFKDISKTFNKYLSNKREQKVIINRDNKGNIEFMKEYPEYRYITFGKEESDYTAKNIEYRGFGSKFEVYYRGKEIDKIELEIPGEHNVYNALGVYAAIKEAKIETKEISRYFKEFTGMGRRFQKVSSYEGIEIYDDYAHHPSEIKTMLESIERGKEAKKRIIAIFQPHRYTRLKSLWKEFKESFKSADKLIVLDVYAAGEKEIEGINSEKFVREIGEKDVKYIKGGEEAAAKEIAKTIKANDIIITLGAGSVTKIGKLIEEEYKKGNKIGINIK